MSTSRSNTDQDTAGTDALPGGEPARLDEDELFHLLQCRRRRDALRYLRDADGPVEMRDLAEQVAAWEHGITVRELASDQRQRVYIPLYQTHLPKLDRVGIIDYDKHRGTVARGPNATTLDPYLEGGERVDADDDGATVPWRRFYLGAAGFGGLAVGGAAFEVPVVSTLSGAAIGALVFGLFCLLTVARVLDDARGTATAE